MDNLINDVLIINKMKLLEYNIKNDKKYIEEFHGIESPWGEFYDKEGYY